MPNSAPSPVVWVITEGLAGTENQCLGIAEAMGIAPIVKRVTLRQPWKLLSPYLGFECAATFQEPLVGPWPDILIASGRKSIAASRYIKKQSQGKSFTVQVQDPRVRPQQFDMVAVPQHDPTRGDHVMVTVATPNRITADKLAHARKDFESVFKNLSSPRIAVLIGGTTKRHIFTTSEARALIQKLSPFKNLMVTTSRRTGVENTELLKSALDTHENYFWDGASSNPYMAMLATADFILVTADSTSMISEAATTGKPVYVIPMAGLTKRQTQLIENLKSYGAVRNFDGKLEHWTYPPLNDSAHIAAMIREKCGLFS
ncbi:MAG TPA: hypothetical protein DCM27_07285 [Rhodospirillaceae bacterium]|nr:hypothetical protein [Rhodospirillaceae bacterium]